MSVPKQKQTHPDDDDFELPPIIWLSEEEAREEFDREARRIVGVSGEEFIRRLHAGEYDNTPDDPEHWDLIFLSEMAPRGR